MTATQVGAIILGAWHIIVLWAPLVTSIAVVVLWRGNRKLRRQLARWERPAVRLAPRRRGAA